MPEGDIGIGAGADGGIDVETDIEIRGAGPVGCALALALRDSGLRVRLVGGARRHAASPLAGPAFRPLALSYASRLILERIGAWDGLSTTAIELVHVSQAGGFGLTRITREELGLPALGYVVDYQAVATHLANLVHEDAGVFEAAGDRPPAPPARLTVHAEGASSEHTAGKDYGYTAIVASIESDRPPHGVAWERFTPEGPLALLPLKDRYGLVWSRASSSAATLMGLDDAQFVAALQSAFGGRAGTFVGADARIATPLMLRYRTARAVAGEVHVGNAARTLHPVAGQGLNLGLRDAWELATIVRGAARDKLGSRHLAEHFARARRLDANATVQATDLMATLYVRRDPVSTALRGAALTALDIFPPARRFFARRMIYGASAW